jgi:hypothetical protein
MRYDLNIRDSVRKKLRHMAQDMSQWEAKPRVGPEEEKQILSAIRPFPHTSKLKEPFRIAGVDGSGDYPSFSYADSFVYVASASGTVYRTDSLHGLVEEVCLDEPTIEFLWIPEDRVEARNRWVTCLEALAGDVFSEVITLSDYRLLKDQASKFSHTVPSLVDALILPRASDSANVGIQLRSTAEFGTALRLIRHELPSRYILMDTTMSLPMVTRRELSLFYEHLKRLCCVEARKRNSFFMTISKSHGFPAMEQIEGMAAEVVGKKKGEQAEHWFLRLPMEGVDQWKFSLAEERRIPPIGAVSYLFRLHKNTPIMRLDMDYAIWKERVRENPSQEVQIFSDLDYASHAQFAYGYPYPIKASHDRSRLTKAERTAIRKQIIDAAVAAGMKRTLFRDVSSATGHA